jgi:hypothetical protein
MVESTRKSPETHVRPRQIVGFTLSPELAREVKAHAAQHGLSLRKLFEDMWQVYKKRATGAKP